MHKLNNPSGAQGCTLSSPLSIFTLHNYNKRLGWCYGLSYHL